MGRHLNAYQIASDVREGVNEFSSAFLQGTDLTGAFTNSKIQARINEAVKFLWSLSFVRGPEDYLTSLAITPVNSLVTLPADFMKLRRLEYADSKQKIHKMELDEKSQGSGTKYRYRPYQRKYLVIDASGVGDSVTAWYYKKPRDIHFGQAVTGSGVLALKMAAAAVYEDDYYNNMIVEDITAAFNSVISDYAGATRVATVTGTAATNDWYGLVPEIPEEFHHLVSMKAILLLKSDPKSPVKPTPKDVADFTDQMAVTFAAYYGASTEDRSIEDIFLDLSNFS